MDGNRPDTLRNAAKAFRKTGRNAAKAFRETGRNAGKAVRETGRNAAKAFRETGRNAGKAFRETLSDDALDGELDAALNAAPSPEFVARVRMRVASEPIAAPWWASWRLVAAGLSVVTLAVALVVWSRPQPAPPAGASITADRTLPAAAVAEPASQSAVAEPAPAPPAVEPPLPGISRAVASAEAGPVRVGETVDGISMTEVIVPADDRRSFEALLLAIQQRRLPPLTPRESDVDELPDPAPIEIADVTIGPVEILRLD